MSTDPELPEELPDPMPLDNASWDDADEARVAWLMTSAHNAPALREEFARELSTRLDAEFAALHGTQELNGHALNGHALSVHALNGHAPVNGDAAVEAAAAADDVPAVVAWRRWVVGVSAAASLLLALAVWADPPAWAGMVQALVATIQYYTVGSVEVRPAEKVVANPTNGGVGTGGVGNGGVGNGGVGTGVPVVKDQPVAVTPSDKILAEDVRTIGEPSAEQIAASASVPTPQIQAGDVMSVKPEDAQPKWSANEEPLAAGELTRRVDEELAALWAAEKIHPVGPASDAEFMRRVYLDLLGRTPSVAEAREFLGDSSGDRREALVDRLLAHHDHATHFAAVWRRILLPDEVDLSRLGGSEQFEEWLSEKFAANVPYDQIVSELLLAEGRVSEPGPLLFYAAVRLEPEELAARTSRAFLGVRMECAQCHDHPFDEKISQQDFWSFAAFFARISRPRGKMEMTSPVLAVRDNVRGDVMIPESDEVVPPRLPGSVMELAEEVEGPSRRAQLVAWLTARDNQHFAEATVNRVWAHLFGRGLVEPVDDMRPDNKPVAPEVLDTLGRDFAASEFDLRRLLRALVLSDAYQLTSREDASGVNDPSRALVFAQMNMKSLTAEQLYDCISVATGRASLAGGPTAPAGLVRFADMSRQAFIEQFRTAPGQVTDYQAGIPQALTLMHGGLIHSATDVAASGLLKSLSAPFFKDDQRLETLYLATLSRYPEPEEREVMLASLGAAKNTAERQQVLGDVLWALLNSAEFTLNH
jgi:hypothetical protein